MNRNDRKQLTESTAQLRAFNDDNFKDATAHYIDGERVFLFERIRRSEFALEGATRGERMEAREELQQQEDACHEMANAAAGRLRDFITSLEELRDSEQEKFDNMPEGLQDGERGQNMSDGIGRIEDAIAECETIADELEDSKGNGPEFELENFDLDEEDEASGHKSLVGFYERMLEWIDEKMEEAATNADNIIEG